MTEISFRRPHGKTLAAARSTAETLAEKLRTRYQIACLWDGDTLRFKREGAAGELALDDREARLRLQLGALLSPMKPLIELQIRKYFEQNFGA